MGFLAGKRVLITGLLSNRSIAYGIAKAARREGAELAFTYQNERFRERVAEMAGEFGSKLAFPCDVASDAEIAALFSELKKNWDGLDGLVHPIAFAPREATADVGNVAAFLLSDLAAGVTGEIVYVDGGFNTVVGGMAVLENSAQ